jgi:hypothetical protein
VVHPLHRHSGVVGAPLVHHFAARFPCCACGGPAFANTTTAGNSRLRDLCTATISTARARKALDALVANMCSPWGTAETTDVVMLAPIRTCPWQPLSLPLSFSPCSCTRGSWALLFGALSMLSVLRPCLADGWQLCASSAACPVSPPLVVRGYRWRHDVPASAAHHTS